MRQLLPLDSVERRVIGIAGLGGFCACIVGVFISDVVLAAMGGIWAGSWLSPWALSLGDERSSIRSKEDGSHNGN